jgi:predicted secreted protein
MITKADSTLKLLERMAEATNLRKDSRLRMRNWERIIQWEIDEDSFFWRIANGEAKISLPAPPDIRIKCSLPTLQKLAFEEIPFFLALWATGEMEFHGSFSDAHRLGYIFLNRKNDRRERRVAFVAHCFLNINTRFPEGSGFAGADLPVIETLLQKGIGIIQMPCPEFFCLGLEKDRAGMLPESELRSCYRKQAESVVDQIEQYLDYGYEISGIIGMNPSPSCGVEVAKGKGKFLGQDEDTSEKEGPGIFIEELINVMKERKVKPLSLFGVRRILTGETNAEERLKILQEKL